MLERFWVTNFKSLVNVEFRPAGVNLLVGPNNAGKTNLCHALRFLGLTARMPLDEAAKECTAEPWNLVNVYGGQGTIELSTTCRLTSGGEDVRFAYDLCLAVQKEPLGRSLSRSLSVKSESLRTIGGPPVGRVLLENNSGEVRLLHEAEDRFVETTAPTTATMLYRLYDLQTNRGANRFKRYLASWCYYSLEPAELRSYKATTQDRTLKPSGANLSSVLYTLHSERPRDERKLVEAASLVEPQLDLLSFSSPDPEHVYMYFEDKSGHRFGVTNVSDGTLRYLALCYLVLVNRRPSAEQLGVSAVTQESASAPDPPLIMIEEAENGIYVGHLKPIFERIDPSGAQGQFIFTSHSPYFIDLFDAALDGLHVVKMGPGHSTITRPERSRIEELLGKFSLGELHFRGLLE